MSDAAGGLICTGLVALALPRLYAIQPYEGGFDGGVLLLFIAFFLGSYLMHRFNVYIYAGGDEDT